jgi:hypothetical protein
MRWGQSGAYEGRLSKRIRRGLHRRSSMPVEHANVSRMIDLNQRFPIFGSAVFPLNPHLEGELSWQLMTVNSTR